MEVANLLEDIPTVEPDDFVTSARKVMRETEVHELPVVEGGRVEGVIRQREILNVTSTKSNVTVRGYVESAPDIDLDTDAVEAAKRMMRTDLDLAPVKDRNGDYAGSVTLGAIFRSIDPDLSGEKVGDHMTDEVEASTADAPVSKVLLKMMETGYTGVPVTKDGGLVGMVTASDVIREGHARVKRESREGDNAKENPRVERLMSTPVSTVEADASLDEAVEKMKARDVGRLPVTKRKKVIGIVDRYDILEALRED